jgi:hypothetical protein
MIVACLRHPRRELKAFQTLSGRYVAAFSFLLSATSSTLYVAFRSVASVLVSTSMVMHECCAVFAQRCSCYKAKCQHDQVHAVVTQAKKRTRRLCLDTLCVLR